MPQINLLPWREELRNRRNKEFGVTAGVVAVVMVGIVFGVHAFLQGRIDFQKQRNQFLEQQIAALNKKIKDIKDLEREKQRLLARMEIIQRLQSSRPEVVHLFDEFVKQLPEGVFYTKITQKGPNLVIDGVAQSNARVSSLMRKYDASAWLQTPALVEIKAQEIKRKGAAAAEGAPEDVVRLSAFKLRVKQRKPKKEGEDAEGS